MKSRIFSIQNCMIIALVPMLFAFGKPQHSKVEASVTPIGKDLQFSFKIVPNADMVVTTDAPWSLTISDSSLELATTSFKKAELNESLTGYQFTAPNPSGAKSGKLNYRLVSFICTKNKTQCFREVHETSWDWAAK